MTPARELAAIAALCAVSLLAVACGMAALFLLLEHLSPSELWGASGAIRAGLYGTLVFGSIPAIGLGGPAYWWLRRSGRASLAAAATLGASLGALVAVVEASLAPWGAGCGLIAAGLAHTAATRWLDSGSSCKPAARRGSV